MSRALFSLSALLVCFTTLAVAQDKKDEKKDDKTKVEKVTVEPASLIVNRKLDTKLFPYSSGNTIVNLVISAPGRELLGVDSTSKMTELKDDKGNSLLDEKSFFRPNFNYTGLTATDRSALVVGTQGHLPPSKGATKVTIKGEVVLLYGTEEKTTEEKKIDIKLNEKAKIGDQTLTVTLEKGFGDTGATVQLSSPQAVKKVVFKDEDGKAIELFPGFTYRDFNTKNWVGTHTLKKQVKEAKVTITYFTKEEKLKVPVDLTFGLDLDGK